MKLFVWDFHGVLEKDNDLAVLDITNQVLSEHGHKVRLTSETNQKYYGLKWFQYFEKLLPNLTSEEHMVLQAACFKFAEENLDILVKHIKPNDYAVEALKAVNGGTTYFYTHPHLALNEAVQADFIITDLRRVLSEA